MEQTVGETMLDKQSESYRHFCEVRWLLRKITASKTPKTAADQYIADVRKARGDMAADALLRSTRKAWAKGMRGAEEPIEFAYQDFLKIV